MAWTWTATMGECSISADTGTGAVTMQLNNELIAQALPGYNGLEFDDAQDVIRVFFTTAPSAATESTTETTVLAHTAPPYVPPDEPTVGALNRWSGQEWEQDPSVCTDGTGDVVLDSASPTLDVGDATGSPLFRLIKDGNGTGALQFRNEGAQSWRFINDAAEDLVLSRAGANTVATFSQSSGDVAIAHNLTLDSASPTVTLGDELGQPTLRFLKVETGGSFIQWRTPSGTGGAWWECQHAGGEALTFNRLSNTGAPQDIPLRLETDGSVTLANDLLVSGDTMSLAGAGAVLTVGSTAETGIATIRLEKDETGQAQVQFRKEGGQSWALTNNTAEDLVLARAGAVTVATFSQSSGDVTIANDLTIDGDVVMGTGGPMLSSGSGTPEGAVTADVGSIFMRTDGGAGTSMYVKESGTGNTGWVAK